MLANQRFLSTVEQIAEITNLKAALYTDQGSLLAAAGASEHGDEVMSFLKEEETEKNTDTEHFFRINVEDEAEYVLVLSGEGYTDVIGRMAAAQIHLVGLTLAEQYDRNNFMQNVILGNLLPIDMVSKAKKLHIEAEKRVVYIIDTLAKYNDLVLETVKNLSNIKSRDFVLRMDESNVILVKALSSDLSPEEEDEELSSTAAFLVDTIQMEAMVRVRVGYGNPVEALADVAKSYQEAKMALEVGRVFYAEQETISYGRLGIGRLIYQLPLSLCEMFIHEVFGDKVPDILEDDEAMNTITKFFENSLNISETARQLYLHRNTLVYRLERIEKAVGLDIRNFDEAMTFRIAVMVLAHMKAITG